MIDAVNAGRGVSAEPPEIQTADPDDQVTPPFLPFDSGPVESGHVVDGAPEQGINIGNGTVYSSDPDAADPTGTRTAFSGDRLDIGGAPDPDALEVLGSRPIANDVDDLFRIDIGGDEEFFGWPDYFHDPDTGSVLPITDPLFCDDSLLQPDCQHEFALEQNFRDDLDVLPAFAQFAVHSSANKFDFSLEPRFGHQGDLFVAETGAFVPITGADRFTGYKVVRVDRTTGAVTDFIVNTGDTLDEIVDRDSFNKPIDVKFDDDVMMIVDFGLFEPAAGIAEPGTGKVWLVSRGRGALQHDGSGDSNSGGSNRGEANGRDSNRGRADVQHRVHRPHPTRVGMRR